MFLFTPHLKSFLTHTLSQATCIGVSEAKVNVKVAQLCLTFCNPMDCSPPDSSVHGILRARILEWVAIPFSRGSSQPRDQTQVSHMAGGFFTSRATREAPSKGGRAKYKRQKERQKG